VFIEVNSLTLLSVRFLLEPLIGIVGYKHYGLPPGATSWIDLGSVGLSSSGTPQLLQTSGDDMAFVAPSTSGGMSGYYKPPTTAWTGATVSQTTLG
jgi:hypothetical protein